MEDVTTKFTALNRWQFLASCVGAHPLFSLSGFGMFLLPSLPRVPQIGPSTTLLRRYCCGPCRRKSHDCSTETVLTSKFEVNREAPPQLCYSLSRNRRLQIGQCISLQEGRVCLVEESVSPDFCPLAKVNFGRAGYGRYSVGGVSTGVRAWRIRLCTRPRTIRFVDETALLAACSGSGRVMARKGRKAPKSGIEMNIKGHADGNTSYNGLSPTFLGWHTSRGTESSNNGR